MANNFSPTTKKKQVISFAQNEIGLIHHQAMKSLTPYQDIAKRLNAALIEAGYTKERHKNLMEVLSKMFDCSVSTVHDWRKGNKCPTMDNSRMIAMKLGICVEWLLTGRGPKHPGEHDDGDNGNYIILDMRDIPDESRGNFEKTVHAFTQSVREMIGHYKK